MSDIQFFLGQQKRADFKAKGSFLKAQSNYTENDPASMDYIQNRPFYSETVTEPLEITWDGFVGDKQYASLDRVEGIPIVYVRVSEKIPSLEELNGATVQIATTQSAETFSFASIAMNFSAFGISGIGCFVDGDQTGIPFAIVTTETQEYNGQTISPGVWLSRILDTSSEDEYVLSTVYISALSIPSFAYEKIYKLNNKYVDAEWMATESVGNSEKEIQLHFGGENVLLFNFVLFDGLYARIDNHFYTEEEFKSGALYLELGGFSIQLPFVAVEDASEAAGIPDGAKLLICTDEQFGLGMVAVSVSEDVEVGGVFIQKGLYIGGTIFEIIAQGGSATVRFLNVGDQTLPNKLPNKFLDLDWIPKMETVSEVIYSGSIQDDLDLGNYPILLDPETVVTVGIDGKVYEVLGFHVTGEGAFYFYGDIVSEEAVFSISVDAIGEAELITAVSESNEITISYRTRTANPMPSEFLPAGVGRGVTIKIDNPIESGADDHILEIEEAWNSGARVTLEFTDYTVSLVSFGYNLDGMVGVGVSLGGRVFVFDPISRGNAWALSVESEAELPGRVLFKAEGDTEFKPAELNSTLTEGSQLPAQEGAVFTAIQDLQNTIGTLNQDLENRLNGGT